MGTVTEQDVHRQAERRATARQVVDRLTRTTKHQTKIEYDDGGSRNHFYDEAALIVMLRVAIRPGMESGGGGGGGVTAGLPVALNALDLMTEIEKRVAEEYWLVKDATRRPGGYTLEERLRFWASRVEHDEQKLKQCVSVLGGWVVAIESLFEPVRKVPAHRHCPGCDAWMVTADDDGDKVRRYAVMVTVSSVPVAECGACGRRWVGPEVNELARDAPTDGE